MKNKNQKENINVLFGQNIKRIRLSKKISQEKLGEIANLHRTYIGMIERGEKNITLINIGKLSKALGISIESLFSGIDD